MRFVLAYDISDDDQREDVADLLSSYGVRVQLSVFECEVDPRDIAGLLEDCYALVTGTDDIISAYPMCRQCRSRREAMGQGNEVLDAGFYIV